MKVFKTAALSVSLILILFSCATVQETSTGVPEYYGFGQADSMVQALAQAKGAAVREAVLEMIGPASEAAHREELGKLLYSPEAAPAFLKNETVEVLRRSEVSGRWNMEIAVQADLLAIEKVLRANGVFGGKVAPGGSLGDGSKGARGSDIPKTTPEAQPAEASDTALSAEEGPSTEEESAEEVVSVTPEERRFILSYVDRMTYMVYFDDGSGQDPFLMEAAVGIANKYLAEQGLPVIDQDQIVRIKKDQEIAYEEQTGEDVSIIQWIARKLNADVYIELDAVTRGETENGKYYGNANITLKLFDTSTATLLGSVPYNSPMTFSASSEFDAVVNALQSSIYKAMPMAMNQAKVYMQKALERGVQYDLLIQNTPDSRLMSDFRRKLRKRVRDVRTISASAEETRYEVYIIGTIEDLEDAIYDITESMPGLEDIELVYFRGKSITFDTGL